MALFLALPHLYLSAHFSLCPCVKVLCVFAFYPFRLSKYFEGKDWATGLSCRFWSAEVSSEALLFSYTRTEYTGNKSNSHSNRLLPPPPNSSSKHLLNVYLCPSYFTWNLLESSQPPFEEWMYQLHFMHVETEV